MDKKTISKIVSLLSEACNMLDELEINDDVEKEDILCSLGAVISKVEGLE